MPIPFFQRISPVSRLLIAVFCAAPVLAPGQSIFDSLRLARRGELFFAFGKSELDGPALAMLDSFAGPLPLLAGVRITAHTDSVGSFENNIALSRRRAQAVKTALAERGIPAQKVETAFFGEREPAAANATEEGRRRNRRATLDAYTAIPMTPYAGQVKDQATGAGIAATVHFSTKTLRDSVLTDSTGRFAVALPTDSVVKIETFARGYFFKSNVQRIFGTAEMLRRMQNRLPEIALTPAKVGEKAVVNNLFFVGNEAILLKTSEPELPKVLKFMQINPTLRVEIAGHINHPGVEPEKLEKWEWALSVNRAKLVYTYLVTHGVRPERMIYKGYGNTEMLFPKPGSTEAQMEQNRRVEIRVIAE